MIAGRHQNVRRETNTSVPKTNDNRQPKQSVASANVQATEPITVPEEMEDVNPKPTFSGQTNVDFGMHQTLRAKCVGPSQAVDVNLLFDNGSSCCFIQESLAQN